MRIPSIYILVSRVLAIVVWDERRDPIYNLSMPLPWIGNRENGSGIREYAMFQQFSLPQWHGPGLPPSLIRITVSSQSCYPHMRRRLKKSQSTRHQQVAAPTPRA